MSEKLLFVRHLVLYGIIGSFTAFLDFCVFFMLTQYLGIHYMVANCMSILVGITTSFMLNRSYNFKVKDKKKQRFAVFLFVGLCGLCLSNGILYVCIDVLSIPEVASKLVSIAPVVLLQFIINKYITFRQTKTETEVLIEEPVTNTLPNDTTAQDNTLSPTENQNL